MEVLCKTSSITVCVFPPERNSYYIFTLKTNTIHTVVAIKPRVHDHTEQATVFSVIFMLFKISRLLESKSGDFKSLLNL